jgi:hypothetical protein
MIYVVIYALVSVLVFGYLGFWVAVECGRGRIEGFVLGALFGPLGVIIVGLLPKFPYEKMIEDARNSPNSQSSADVYRDLKAVEEWHRTH